MNKRSLKAATVGLLSIFTLTSCNTFTSLLDRIMGGILVNTAMSMPILVNGLDVLPEFDQNNSPALIEWENQPTSNNARADLDYIKNVLVVPETLSATIPFINQTFTVNFATTITKGEDDASDNFHYISVAGDDLPPEFDFGLDDLPFEMSFSIGVYIPVGNSNIFADVDEYSDLTEMMESDSIMTDVLEAIKQDPQEITFSIAASSSTTSKSKNFYFRLVKPEVGDLLFERIFALDELLHIFTYTNDISEDNIMDNLTAIVDKPTDPNNPTSLTYFKKSLILPKEIETTSFGDVTLDYEVIYPNGTGPDHLFKEVTMTKPVAEFTDSDLVTGNISVAALTPVGTYYDELSTVDSVDDLKAHFTDDNAAKRLYRHTFQEDISFALEVTISNESFGEDSRTYYFNVDRPLFDQEIVDEVIKQNVLVNKVNYKDIENNDFKLSDSLPTDPHNPLDFEYLVDTLAIPTSVKLNEYLDPNDKPKEIFFDVAFENPDDEALFFNGEKTITGADNPDYDEYDVTVGTFTPLGGLDKTHFYNHTIEEFADEIIEMVDEDTKTIYNAVSGPSRDVTMTITARTTDGDGNTTATANETFYFRLIRANIDNEVLDYIENEDSLLNVVNYEDIDAVSAIANDAQDSENPYLISHFEDTLVIPSKIIVDGFSDKELRISSDIRNDNEDIQIFNSTKETEVDNNDITATTLTSLGSYNYTGPDNLEALADELDDLSGQEWYSHSQAATTNIEIDITISLWTENEVGEFTSSGEERMLTFYIQINKPNVDKRIGDEILKYDLVNYFEIEDPDNIVSTPQPTDINNPEAIEYFKTTLIMPKTIEFNDFGNKTVNFNFTIEDLDGNDRSDYFLSLQKEFDYDGQEDITGQSFTPIGTYVMQEQVDTFEQLTPYVSTYAFDILNYKSTASTYVVAITVEVEIESENELGHVTTYTHPTTNTYYFHLVN